MEKSMQRLKQEKILLDRMKKGAERNFKSMYFISLSFHLFLLSILFIINDIFFVSLFQAAKVVK